VFDNIFFSFKIKRVGAEEFLNFVSLPAGRQDSIRDTNTGGKI